MMPSTGPDASDKAISTPQVGVGIGVYSSAPAAQSYTVMEGDPVRLIGSIGQFNGLTQMYPDSIAFISSNNTLPTPTVVTQLGENTESELVTFTSATLVDPSQWTGSGSGFNVDITNGRDTIAMRIDNDVDVYSQAAPTGAFDVTGIGGSKSFKISISSEVSPSKLLEAIKSIKLS